MQNNKISSLSLMLSCGCNLNCSYCLIAQSQNIMSPTIQAKTQESLQDGTFLLNTLNVLNKINVNPKAIKNMQFWGQEPTLNLHLYTEHIQDWMMAFPNVTSYMFSTNGKHYPERIIDFAQQLEKYSTKKTLLELQFSYDGEIGNDGARNVDSQIVTENLKKVIIGLNTIHFKYVKIKILFNGVLSDLVKEQLNTIEKMQQFESIGKEWIQDIIDLTLNKNIEIQPVVPTSLMVPVLGSVEDGFTLNDFCKRLYRANFELGKGYTWSILKGYTRIAQNIRNKLDISIVDALNIIMDKEQYGSKSYIQCLSLLSATGFCNPNLYGLKIMYDGTLLDCHASIFDTENQYIKNNGLIEYSAKKNRNIYKLLINPLNATSEELEKFFYFYDTMLTESFMTTLNETINLMYILAKFNQIDPEYQNNYQKLLLHSFVVMNTDTCIYNRYLHSGIHQFIPIDQIRMLCNGFLDTFIDENGEIKELHCNE